MQLECYIIGHLKIVFSGFALTLCYTHTQKYFHQLLQGFYSVETLSNESLR